MIKSEDNNGPLVSVVVITYNSAKTVLETLDSIKTQTYQNIELIISDDCSQDDSVIICNQWIEKNRERFTRALIIESTYNTGTAANMNRAISASKGEWFKVCAADDKLLQNCLEDNLNYVIDHPETNIIFSKVVGFGNMEAAREWPYLNVKRFFDKFDAKRFRVILSTQNFLPAPSAFIKRCVWENVGGYNESIPLLEDWPFWVKVLQYGYVFDFLDKETVCYRFSDSSISQGNKPLSREYLDSNSKAAIFANKSLAKIDGYFWYLYQTRRFVYRLNRHLTPVLLLMNFFNPAYYEFRNTIRKFQIITKEFITF